jgi:hypothetical protein
MVNVAFLHKETAKVCTPLPVSLLHTNQPLCSLVHKNIVVFTLRASVRMTTSSLVKTELLALVDKIHNACEVKWIKVEGNDAESLSSLIGVNSWVSTQRILATAGFVKFNDRRSTHQIFLKKRVHESLQ